MDLFDNTPSIQLSTRGSGAIACVDLNNDGYDELITGRTGSVFANNNGTLEFQPAIQSPANPEPGWGSQRGHVLVINDFNVDGKKDVLFAGTNDLGWQIVTAYLNVMTLSTEEYETPKVSIYPNPTRDYVYIESMHTIEQVQIVDMTGRISKVPFYQNMVDMNNFSSGVYLLHYVIDGRNYTAKIVKL